MLGGVFGHRLVLGSFVRRLPGTGSPHVEILGRQLVHRFDFETDLACDRGSVTGRPHQHWVAVFPEFERQFSISKIAAVPKLVQPRHDVASARHADCGGHVVAVKDDPIRRQGIQVGGFYL